MPSKLKFSTETIDGTLLGRLEIPQHKVAGWINFLVSPQQQAEIVSAQHDANRLVLYFKAPETLYLYLRDRCNSAAL